MGFLTVDFLKNMYASVHALRDRMAAQSIDGYHALDGRNSHPASSAFTWATANGQCDHLRLFPSSVARWLQTWQCQFLDHVHCHHRWQQ